DRGLCLFVLTACRTAALNILMKGADRPYGRPQQSKALALDECGGGMRGAEHVPRGAQRCRGRRETEKKRAQRTAPKTAEDHGTDAQRADNRPYGDHPDR